ncbi:MAG: CAP domain-containing protein [Clostridium sp.]|uniref:CAP domain-containing protein n=1 Tax=Clostridium sp. TaxID=1506 RepID=UPI0025C04A2F|nr:CAP domain-containing protein [Clostridium sp.]MCF0147021.1 CAP domain-containing protein [Clostridium sp.]
MIKSRLATLVLSMGLATVVAISGVFLSSNNESIKNKEGLEKIETKETAESNIDKEENIEIKDESSEDIDKGKDNDTKKEETNDNENNEINKGNQEVNNENNASNELIEKEENTVPEVVLEPQKPAEQKVEPSNSTPKPAPPEPQKVTPVEAPKERTVVVDDNNYINQIEQAIFQILNQERTNAGLSQLSYNTTMQYYARVKSKDMGDNGYFNHTDLNGRLMNEIIKADGITYRAWGENIAYIQGLTDNNELSARFMNNWMNSAGHKANILSNNFSSIGVGVYKIGNTYYATQEFYN